jgi:UDP-N-acetylglucosamine 3-dehydrogenase
VTAVKIAVIGAGVMGRNYLRAAKGAGIEIAAVADADAKQATSAAAEFGCTVATDLHDITAAVIAVPTAAHAGVAGALLKRGVHCLVEKPFAATEAECRALIETAAINRAVLQVGHVERFNPAIAALLALNVDPATITGLTARRMGPASARVTDVSVVVDLMVHDLDILLALKRTAVKHVEAVGNRDHAEVRLTFADGTTASLTASRAAAARVRDLHVITAGAAYHLDYIAKSLLTALPEQPAPPAQIYEGDALAGELRHFITCIEDSLLPRATGEQALEVMKLAWRIEAALGIAGENAA